MAHKKKSQKQEEAKKERLVEVSSFEIDKLKKEAEEYKDKWLKVHAEYENTRKRLEKEKHDHIKFANEDIISKLFPIMDNFDMAFAAMEKAEDKEAVMEGIKLVQKEFHRVLEENGVERIETVGKEFDPNLHEAVQAVETEEVPDGEIVEEVRSGYLLNGRILRPAKVKVAKN